MSQRIVINSLTFGREAGLLEGKLQIASLARVLDLLADSAGHLAYRVKGKVGARNRSQLWLELDGTLSLCCQRCLEGVEYPLEMRSLLEFVDDEDELTQEEIEDDSKDFLLTQKELDVMALIEDEIILALPVAPCHESCATPEIEHGAVNLSPFSVLTGLKGKA